MDDPLVAAVRQLLPLVRDMLPRHPTSDKRINLIKKCVADVEDVLRATDESSALTGKEEPTWDK